MTTHNGQQYQTVPSTDNVPIRDTRQLHQYEDRLPDGMQRIGYDADTQTYTFRDDEDGALWESEPGVRDGRLRRVGAIVVEGDVSFPVSASKIHAC